MTPEQKARISIDKKLEQSGWMVQDVKRLNPMASLGVAVREFPTDTGPVDSFSLIHFFGSIILLKQKKVMPVKTSLP